MTGTLSNNGVITPSTNTNYTFSLTLPNKIPVGGTLKIVNVPGLAFTSSACTTSLGTCVVDGSGNITITFPVGTSSNN